MKLLSRLIGFYFNTVSWIFPSWVAKQAFYLFGHPFKAKLSSTHQHFLKTGNPRNLEVKGKKVQYYTWGTGEEKLLFVHGWQSHAYRWKSFIESFDHKKYTLYAFDAPGHGNSEGSFCTVPLYEDSMFALMQKHGPMDHLVAHSIGSFSTASYMFNHDFKVKSYISLASPFSAEEFLLHFYEQLALSKRAKKYLKKHFENYIKSPVEDFTLAKFSTGIQPERTLIIHDKMDESTPIENALKFHELLKEENLEVTLVRTDQLKHNLRSPKVVEMVVSFVEGQDEPVEEAAKLLN